MSENTEFPDCCDERFSGIRRKVVYTFKEEKGIEMLKDTEVYTLVDPRAYFGKNAFYTDRTPKYKGSSTKRGDNPKAIKARRKKNKNKKTHRK